MNALIGWITLIVLLQSCEKSDDFLFEIPIEFQIEMPAGLNPFDSHFFLARNVFTNFGTLSERFDGDTSSYEIVPIRAEMLALDADNGLGYMREVAVFVFNGADPDQNDAFAFINDLVPTNASNLIRMSPFSENLASYLTGNTANFKIRVRTRSTSLRLVESRILLVFGARRL